MRRFRWWWMIVCVCTVLYGGIDRTLLAQEREETTTTIAVATEFQRPIAEGDITRKDIGYGIKPYVSKSSSCWGVPWSSLLHAGVDIFTEVHAPVYAIANGEVVYVHDGKYPGTGLIIRHHMTDGSPLYSMYGHLATDTVVGLGPVAKGQVIGEVYNQSKDNNTHLHFEVRTMEYPADPTGCSKLGSGYTPNTTHPDDRGYLNPYDFIDDFNFYSKSSKTVWLFDRSYFRGNAYPYWVAGKFVFYDEGGLNNTISSIALPGGWSLNAYDEPTATGKYTEFFEDTLSLNGKQYSGGGSVDDSISAVRIFTVAQCTPNLRESTHAQQAKNAPHCIPAPDPTAAPNPNPTPAPTPQPDPGSVVGVRFYSEKHYGGGGTKLGYGSHDFTADFLSVRLDSSDMRFTTYDQGGGSDCFDARRFGGNIEYPSMNDHGDWWQKTTRIVVEYGTCPQSAPPTKWIVFYREKNFVNRFTEKPVGFSGGFSDDFQSVRLDNGVSFIATNDRGESSCFDKWRFGGSGESSSFNDHGDWWQNTTHITVQNTLCPPGTAELLSPRGSIPFNTDVTLSVRPPNNGVSVYGELWGLAAGPWYFNQPVANTKWHIGVLPPGMYTVVLQAINDYGRSQRVEITFTVEQAPDCNSSLLSGIQLFAESSCSGDVVSLTTGGEFNLAQFDNQASSIYIEPGWSVEVLDSSSTTTGYATCLTETQWDLAYTAYRPNYNSVDDSISLVRVFTTPNCGKQLPIIECDQHALSGVALFDYMHCLGSEQLFTTPGVYNLTDFSNEASSIYVAPGWSVRVFQDHSQGGKFACFRETKWNLSFDSFWFTEGLSTNNSTMSIEVFADSECGWPEAPQLYSPAEEITDETDLTLNWENMYAAAYYSELWGIGINNSYYGSGRLESPEWHVGKLLAGTYRWLVTWEQFGSQAPPTEYIITVTEAEEEEEAAPSYFYYLPITIR